MNLDMLFANSSFVSAQPLDASRNILSLNLRFARAACFCAFFFPQFKLAELVSTKNKNLEKSGIL